jgi:biopolymer transport protein ExbB
MIVAVVAMAVLLPIFGLSVAVIAAGSRLARVRAYPQADPDRKASGMFRTALLTVTAAAILSMSSGASAQQHPAVTDPNTAVSQPAGQVSSANPPAPASAQAPSAPQRLRDPGAPAAEHAPTALNSMTPGLRELSPWSMFLSADIVVKAVMIGLAFASLVTWTAFIAKTIELSLVKRKLRAALNAIREATSLAEAQRALGSRQSILSFLLSAAMREARLSAGISSDSGIKERVASSFAEILRAESRRIRLGMGVLATIGATAPFVGLFGTVWGIMNSFIGISKSQTTNLAVVAPGIAEALLATAIGLVAAIPAVIIYNHFSRVTKGYLELVSRASGATARLLSRDLDRSHGSALTRAAE